MSPDAGPRVAAIVTTSDSWRDAARTQSFRHAVAVHLFNGDPTPPAARDRVIVWRHRPLCHMRDEVRIEPIWQDPGTPASWKYCAFCSARPQYYRRVEMGLVGRLIARVFGLLPLATPKPGRADGPEAEILRITSRLKAKPSR